MNIEYLPLNCIRVITIVIIKSAYTRLGTAGQPFLIERHHTRIIPSLTQPHPATPF